MDYTITEQMDYTILEQIKKKESLDYLEGFKDASIYIMKEFPSFSLFGELAEAIERITEDYSNEILAAMECHEASTHFEDYMNEPVESQMSDNDVPYENCMNMHNEATSSIECLECNCTDCPYSRG